MNYDPLAPDRGAGFIRRLRSGNPDWFARSLVRLRSLDNRSIVPWLSALTALALISLAALGFYSLRLELQVIIGDYAADSVKLLHKPNAYVIGALRCFVVRLRLAICSLSLGNPGATDGDDFQATLT